MGADIRRPNIVVRIYTHGMSSDEKIVGNAAQEFAIRVELHQRMFSAVKNVDMALGIYRYTGDLDEMFVRW
jgi:hypothetical protein